MRTEDEATEDEAQLLCMMARTDLEKALGKAVLRAAADPAARSAEESVEYVYAVEHAQSVRVLPGDAAVIDEILARGARYGERFAISRRRAAAGRWSP